LCCRFVRQLPDGTDPFILYLYLYAALSEKERAMILTRTKHALAAAKARGVRLDGLYCGFYAIPQPS
jgi:DNA invertase Pin-like site-specific DNA recombinase